MSINPDAWERRALAQVIERMENDLLRLNMDEAAMAMVQTWAPLLTEADDEVVRWFLWDILASAAYQIVPPA